MYCIQYDEICKKHNFELEHDAHGDGVSLKYPAGLAPKYTLRLSQNHLPEEVSAMAEKYGSDRFAVFMYNATAAAGNTISLAETLEENKKVSAALSDLADDLKQAELALTAYKGGLQIGGGVTQDNAERFIDMGASHVIVTSCVFKNGEINMDNLKALVSAVSKEHLVLDLSCRRRADGYYIVTDRWQKFTNVPVNRETMDFLSEYCDEYLIHAVDVEGCLLYTSDAADE